MKEKLKKLLRTLEKNFIWSAFHIDQYIGLKSENFGNIYITVINGGNSKEILIFYGDKALYHMRRFYLDPFNFNLLKLNDRTLSIKKINLAFSEEIENEDLDLETQEMWNFSPLPMDFGPGLLEEPTDEEVEVLLEVVPFLLEFCSMVEQDLFRLKDYKPLDFGKGMIPLFQKEENTYSYRDYQLPDKVNIEGKVPFNNELLFNRYKRLPRIDTLQLEILNFIQQKDKDGRTFNEQICFIVEELTGFAFPFRLMNEMDLSDEEILNQVVQKLYALKLYPKRIKVPDERTYNLLEEFSNKLQIELTFEEVLKQLNEAEEYYAHFIGVPNPFAEDKSLFEKGELSQDLHYRGITSSSLKEDSNNNNDFESVEKDFVEIIYQIYDLEFPMARKPQPHQAIEFHKIKK